MSVKSNINGTKLSSALTILMELKLIGAVVMETIVIPQQASADFRSSRGDAFQHSGRKYFHPGNAMKH